MKKLFLFLLLVISCSDGLETLVYPPGSVPPVVTGIYVIDETGKLIGVLGKPSSPVSSAQYSDEISISESNIEGSISPIPEPLDHIAYKAYPNPTSERASLSFEVPKHTKVTILLVQARGSDDFKLDDYNLINNAQYLTVNNEPIKLLDRTLSAGLHIMSFEIPELGFYRIYIQAGDFLTRVDILNLDIESWYDFWRIN